MFHIGYLSVCRPIPNARGNRRRDPVGTERSASAGGRRGVIRFSSRGFAPPTLAVRSDVPATLRDAEGGSTSPDAGRETLANPKSSGTGCPWQGRAGRTIPCIRASGGTGVSGFAPEADDALKPCRSYKQLRRVGVAVILPLREADRRNEIYHHRNQPEPVTDTKPLYRKRNATFVHHDPSEDERKDGCNGAE